MREAQSSGDILVVDDSELVHRLQEYVVKRLGLTVAHAYDGLEALKMARQRRYHAILLDLNMPVMDGVSFLRGLRSEESAAGREPTPVLVVSTEGADEEIRRTLQAGATAFIKKPFTHDQIRALLEKVLDLSSRSKAGT